MEWVLICTDLRKIDRYIEVLVIVRLLKPLTTGHNFKLCIWIATAITFITGTTIVADEKKKLADRLKKKKNLFHYWMQLFI